MKGSVVTIGTFDGVHLGHKKILDDVIKNAKENGLLSSVIIMERPVKKVDGVITLAEEKSEIISSLGADKIIILPVNKTILNTTASDFLKNVIIKQLNAKQIVVGYNCAFGKNRQGNTSWLKKNAKKYGIKLTIIKPVKISGQTVSSSKIRDFIKKGDIEAANMMLGRIFEINGIHVPGNKIGRTIGFPTVNVSADKIKILPKGIFACSMCGKDGVFYTAVLNIGTRPTFKNLKHNIAIEVHILNFYGKWHSKHVKILVTKFIRKEKKFSDIKSLQNAISSDVKLVQDAGL